MAASSSLALIRSRGQVVEVLALLPVRHPILLLGAVHEIGSMPPSFPVPRPPAIHPFRPPPSRFLDRSFRMFPLRFRLFDRFFRIPPSPPLLVCASFARSLSPSRLGQPAVPLASPPDLVLSPNIPFPRRFAPCPARNLPFPPRVVPCPARKRPALRTSDLAQGPPAQQEPARVSGCDRRSPAR